MTAAGTWYAQTQQLWKWERFRALEEGMELIERLERGEKQSKVDKIR